MTAFPLAPAPAPLSPVVLDGGLGTWLGERGNDITGALWSAQILVDNPAEVTAAHRDFYQAGAQVATTCSYEVTYDGLASLGFAATGVDELLRTSVRLAREAGTDIDHETWVAASVGPYGAGPGAGTEYDGAYGLGVRELEQWHARRLEVLAQAGADIVVCETVPSIREMEALATLLERLDVPALLSVHVRAAGAGSSPATGDTATPPVLGDGTALAELAAIVADTPHIRAVGVNCCAASVALAALGTLQPHVELPFMVYPNSGEQWDHEQRIWHPGSVASEDSISAQVPAFLELGVRYIGGCCRVVPEEIAAIGAAVRSYAA